MTFYIGRPISKCPLKLPKSHSIFQCGSTLLYQAQQSHILSRYLGAKACPWPGLRLYATSPIHVNLPSVRITLSANINAVEGRGRCLAGDPEVSLSRHHGLACQHRVSEAAFETHIVHNVNGLEPRCQHVVTASPSHGHTAFARRTSCPQIASKVSLRPLLHANSAGILNSFAFIISSLQKRDFAHSAHPLNPQKPANSETSDRSNLHGAYVALGSNLGDRFHMVETACRMMSDRGIQVNRTSALYETNPMYLQDQPKFLNGACEITTRLDPHQLLHELKDIESTLGRIKVVDNGPRPIDLDILAYDNVTLQEPALTIPHPKIAEREFVLRPLCDLAPDAILPGDNSRHTLRQKLEALNGSSPNSNAVPLVPLRPNVSPLSPLTPNKPTHLMAVLNLTPDSFSDGGLYQGLEADLVLSNLKEALGDTASPVPIIIDIGGQSTRPHAAEVSPDEETSRVLPTVRALRADPFFDQIPISIDTYHASVAESAVGAGADIVNDISAGTLDPTMLSTIARLGCTCILMHMRGTPQTMNRLANYLLLPSENESSGVIPAVAAELLTRLRAAEDAGIRRWRILLDPGIGFAKHLPQNIELIRRFSALRTHERLGGYPWVVGMSRKAFIGTVTGVPEPSQRLMGTAVCADALVRQGVDVLRVHDVRQIREAVRMADALWRGRVSM